jgi:hypothetical protein
MLPEMYDKNVDIESIAEKALADEGVLAEMMDGLRNKNETLRYNCFKVLMAISREHGEILYPQWNFITEMLDSSNTYHKLSAIQLLASLCGVDKDGRFDEIFDKYFSLLGDTGTILAAHAAGNAGKIARTKPHLRAKITGILLDIDRIYQGKQVELVKCSVIEAFSEYFEVAEDKERIKEFVRNQLNSESPKTRKWAKAFLDKWG